MIFSTASVPSTRGARSAEFEKVESLFPHHLRESESAKKIIGFIDEYYKYLNQNGLPSYELKSIVTEHDIDRVSAKYLDNFANEIAKTVPNSRVIDRVTLYKYIVRFYKERSTEDTVIAFFRIFLGALAEVYFPNQDLFRVSAAENSIPSSNKKIQDSRFWQTFSYVIRTDVNAAEWLDSYLRFVHPAGLRLFVEIIIEAIMRNDWISPITYNIRFIEEDVSWLRSLIPAFRNIFSPDSTGQHLPRFQPGWLSANLSIIRLLLGQSNHLREMLRINEDGSVRELSRIVTPPSVIQLQNGDVVVSNDGEEAFVIPGSFDYVNMGDDEWVRRVFRVLKILIQEYTRNSVYKEFDSLTMHRQSNFAGTYSLLDMSLEDLEKIGALENTTHFHNFNLTAVVFASTPTSEFFDDSWVPADVFERRGRLGSFENPNTNWVIPEVRIAVSAPIDPNYSTYSTVQFLVTRREI